MGFRLEPKEYDWKYLIKLPFLCDPVCTGITLAQKLAVGAAFVAWAFAEAGLIDGVLGCAHGRGEWDGLLLPFGVLLFLAFVRRMGYSLGRFFTRKLQEEGSLQVRRELVKKASRVPYRLLEDRAFHDLLAYLQREIHPLLWDLPQQGGDLCQALLRIAGTLLVLCLLDVRVGAAALFALVPLVCFYIRNVWELAGTSSQTDPSGRRADYLLGLSCGRDNAWERSLFGYMGYVGEDWKRQEGERRRERMGRIKEEKQERLYNGILMHAVFLLLVLSLFTLCAQGRVTPGWLLASVHLIYEMDFNVLNGLYTSSFVMAHSMTYFRRLSDFADLPETEGTNDLPGEEEPVFEGLEFKKVSFRYPGSSRYVLRNLDLRMEAGKRYALVGENGSGKTTLVKILTGLYDSYEGSILLNGRELREYAPDKRKAMFAAVYQGSARYEETIGDNILMGDMREFVGMRRKGDSGSGKERIFQCADRLGLWDMVQTLPEGLDTLAGRESVDGAELSEGQWQRVILARLLVNPAPVRILDEPTAALDPLRESYLYEQFDLLNEGRTTLYISHRLGAVCRADTIFVLGGGKVQELGDHESLLQKGGLYAGMYESQKRWYV